MLFINAALLAGLAAVLAPVILHLWSKRKPKFTDWAAMQFLVASVAIRQRKIELEDVILLLARCLVVALLALALARPFIPAPASSIPWVIVVPLGFLALAALAATAALWHDPIKRFTGLLLTALASFASWQAFHSERALQEEKLGKSDPQDIVLIVDASASMGIAREGKTNLERALSEARQLIDVSEAETAFAVIQAGLSPKELSKGLTTDRRKAEEALNQVEAALGSMNAIPALTMGLELLESGRHPNKKLIIFTDRQQVGWDTTSETRWNLLASQIEKAFPKPPALLLWHLPYPEDYRNLAITHVDTQESLVKQNVPTHIEVTYENTGATAMTPRGIECTVGEVTHTSFEVDQLAPGESTTIAFEHVFQEPGPHPVRTRLLVEDDMESDHHQVFIAQAAKKMRVLAVDDGPKREDYFAGGAAYIRLALETSASDDAEEDHRFESHYRAMEAMEEETSQARSANTIWLAAPQKLPETTRADLTAFVEAGGGLIISLGAGADPAFYNGWSAEGRPFLPATLLAQVKRSRLRDRIHVELRSLKHGPLHDLSDPLTSDLQTALFSHYWQVAPHGAIRARFNNGDPLILSQPVGLGQVWMFTAGLDSESSSLVTRDCFLPLVQELATAVAGTSATDSRASLNLDAQSNLTLILDPTPPGTGRSLTAEITTPAQHTFEVEVARGGSGISSSFDWDGTAGLFHLRFLDAPPAALGDLMDSSQRIPFAVRPDLAESRRDLLVQADIDIMKTVFDVYEIDRLEHTVQILQGMGFGEELWRLFALGALGFLVFEMVLARWVSRRRRLGETLRAGVTA